MKQQAVARDFDQWSDLVSSSFVPLAAKAVRPGAFEGQLGHRRFGDTVMSQISASPHAVVRTSEQSSEADPAYYKVSFQRAGHGLLIQDGREAVIQPGQFAIYDTSRPYTLWFDSEFSTHVLMVPRSRFALAADALTQLTATSLGEGHHLSSVVAQFVERVGSVLPGLNDATGSRLTANVVDLLGTVMADQLGASGGVDDTAGQGLFSSVLAYIDQHLDDPGLDPQRIAAAHFMSLRSLHHLFDGTGQTVAATIRDRRLQRCRDDLADSAQRRTPVAAIGARWGFMDPAHFSRIFRRAFGQSPSQFRARG